VLAQAEEDAAQLAAQVRVVGALLADSLDQLRGPHRVRPEPLGLLAESAYLGLLAEQAETASQPGQGGQVPGGRVPARREEDGQGPGEKGSARADPKK
jgi:hypothetical protein